MPFRNILNTQPTTVHAPSVGADSPMPEKYVQVMFADDLPLNWMKAAVILGIVNLGGLMFLIWEVLAHGMGK